MKSFKTFKEYLSSKGKVVTAPPVEATPDYKGPKEKSPKKGSTKGKNWEVPNVGSKGTPAPYKSGTDKAPKKAEKGGFAHMGDKGLVYEPGDGWYGGKNGVSKSTQGVSGGKSVASWPKGGPTTTESFLKATKGMTTAEFAKHVKKGLTENVKSKKAPHVVAHSAGAFYPDPVQAIRYVAYLANENANLRNALVREINRSGGVQALVNDLLTIPEAFKALAKIIESKKGEAFQRRLEHAIREEVDEPAHDDSMDIEDVDPSEEKRKVSDEEDDLDLDDDGEGDEDGGDVGDNLDLDDEGGPGEGGDEDMPPPPPGKGDMGGDDLGDSGEKPDLGGEMDDMAGGDEDSPPPPPGKGGMGDEGGDDDHKLDFSDDLGLDDDNESGDDDLDDEDDDDSDDEDDEHEKMPWEEDDDM